MKINKNNPKIDLNNKITYLIFIWSFLLFVFHLYFSLNSEINTVTFVISIIGMIGSTIFQIFKGKNINELFILLEILIINVCLHLTYQVGFSGLLGSDSYTDFKFFETILNNNSFDLNAYRGISSWPDLHIFSTIFTTIARFDSMIVAKYFPSFFTSSIILFIYLLSYQIYKSNKAALMACLIFATIPKYMSFGSLFIREIFGLFAIITSFYFIYVSKTKDKRFIYLSLILICVLVLSHHFSSLVFILLMLIFLIISVIVPFFLKNIQIKSSKLNRYLLSNIKYVNITNLFILVFVIVFSYWIYNALEIWNNFGLFFSNLITLGETPFYSTDITSGTVVSLKGNIILYGTYAFFAIFSLILLLKVMIDKRNRTEDMTLIFFLFSVGLFGLISTYFLTSLIYPDRLLSYGWLLGVIPLSGVILTLDKYDEIYKKIFVFSLILFISFNLYNIPLENITNDFTTLMNTNDKEIAIAEDIIFPEYFNESVRLNKRAKNIYGYMGVGNIINYKWGIQIYDTSKMKNFTDPSVVAIINEKGILRNIEIEKIKDPKTYQKKIALVNYKNEKNNKICDVGDVYILRPSP